MSRRVLFASVFVVLVTVLGVVIADAQGSRPGPRAPGALTGTGFTYQGQLKNGGALVNGNCDFGFRLYDVPSSGMPIGSVISTTVPVTYGLFTVQLDFGANAINGDARWLDVLVRCGGGAYAALTRQALTPAPMALALPGLYTQQNMTSTNVIGGYSRNIISETVHGGTISGGGRNGYENKVWANYATVGGGVSNIASSYSAAIGGGYNNTAGGNSATVGGGVGNTASGDTATVGGGNMNTASGYLATIPGGVLNSATMSHTLAAGRPANAVHEGAFVWGDSANSDISSTKDDQFVIRARGGVSLTVNAGSATVLEVGERYRDNAIIAWAKVTGFNGDPGTSKLGVSSIAHATGIYTVTLTAEASNAATLIPIAIAEIDNPPTIAAAVRIVSINQIATNQFVVYINNGNWALTDNDFVFMVTGR